MSVTFRYLSQEEIVQLGGLDMTLAIQDMEEVLRLWAIGQCVLPSKVILRWGDLASEATRGLINAMPAYVGGRYQMAGIKWIGCMYSNPSLYGLPSLSALTILNDPVKGLPVAVMDGTLISAMRTGAVVGVAAKHLARSDAQTVGIIGAGVQSRAALSALKTALPHLTGVLAYDIRPERAAVFCQEMGRRLSLPADVVQSPQEAANRADVLVTATNDVEPVLARGWVAEGCLYCQVGGNECEGSAIRDFDKIVVDNWYEIQQRQTSALARAKANGIISDDDIYAQLSDLVMGKKPGRQSSAERIFFGVVGMGIEDIAIATRILRRAEEEQVGAMLTLWQEPAFI